MSRLEKRLTEQKNIRSQRTILIAGLLVAVMAIASASYYWLSRGVEKNKKTEGFLAAQNKINILVEGVDERADDVGRSDTLFVLTVDTNTKQVAMLSVPRDTRVKIPGYGWDKINHAYAFGGHSLSIKAVEGLLGIKIDHYVLINIGGFKKIIDAIGGVSINVEKRMHYVDPYDDNGDNGGPLVIDLNPGLQKMDGRTAVQYVRYRDEEGDIGRVERQQKFLKALLSQIATPSIITKIPAIITEVSSVIKTDMSTGEMLNLGKIVHDAAEKGLKTDMVPGKPAYIDEISYWIPDLMALRQHIAQTLGVTMEDKYLAATKREVVEYETSIPKNMKIVEPTKPVQAPKAPSKPKTAEIKKPVLPENKTVGAEPIKVEVINASGVPEAGEKMAASLKAQGFVVTSVLGMTNPYKSTVVVSNTTNSAVVHKLTGLPFKYSLQVNKAEGKGSEVVVYIGQDYIK